MRIIVTGASGFVGGHLIRYLAGRHDVICIGRDTTKIIAAPGVEVLTGDLRHDDWIARLPGRADAIIHLAQAAANFPEGAGELFAVNARSTQLLASYARTAGIGRFVFASTGSVYRRRDRPITESDPVEPSGFYAATKAIAELILHPYEEEFGVTILRLFAPYGPGQLDRMIPRLIDAVRQRRPITVVNGGQPRLNPIHVSDLAAIFEGSLHLDGSQIVNVAGPEVVGVADIVRLAAEVIGRDPVIIEETRPGTGDLVADSTLMMELFAPGRLIAPSTGIRALIEETDARLPA